MDKFCLGIDGVVTGVVMGKQYPSRETATEKHKGEQQEDTLSAQQAAPRAGSSGEVGIKTV